MRLRRPSDRVEFHHLFTASAEKLVEGATLLAEMLAEDSDKAGISTRMHDAEHAADTINHEIAKLANATFVTPIDREDILLLGGSLDDVMDYMDEVVEQIYLFDIRVLPAGVSDQVEVLQHCAELTAAAMPRLTARRVEPEYWIEINRLENQGDHNHRRLLAELFSGRYPALDVLKLKGIADALEAAINAFETAANLVEQITVKSA